jgi:hypothetical protein
LLSREGFHGFHWRQLARESHDSLRRRVETRNQGRIHVRGLVMQYWQGLNNLRVFCRYDMKPSAKKQMDKVLEDAIPFVVFVGETEVKEGIVKVGLTFSSLYLLSIMKNLVKHRLKIWPSTLRKV